MYFLLYRHDKGIRYYKHRNKLDTLYEVSTYAKPKFDLKYDLELSVDTILNYVCDKLTVYNDNGSKTSFYFSSEIKLNHKFYKDFTEYNKNKITNIMKSHYLRMTYENDLFIADMIAVDIHQKTLNDSIFEIPNHKYSIEIKP